jgi:hypothetical protein
MSIQPNLLSTLLAGVLALAGGAGLAACGDAHDDGDAPGGSDGGGNESPLYAMMIQVYGTDDRTVYVHLSDTLELGEIDLTKTREFAGVANFAPIDGKLLISSGTEPSITEYEISDSFEWKQARTVSFADYPFEDNANFYYQYILSDDTAYMPFDVTNRLIWNPSAMTIEETREDSSLELFNDGLQLQVGGNRNAIRFDGPVQQAFFYVDEDWYRYGSESYVVIYDERTHEEQDVVTLPCPGLSMASQDEDGFTYYGTWDFQGIRALFGEGPDPCVARLKPDLTLDAAWTTDLRDLTGGRYVNNFRYIGGGRAIGNVFHHELIEADWDAGYDPDVAEAINKSGGHWRFWLFDLESWEAKPVEGIDVAISGGAQFAVLDGRTFVFLPYDDWSKSKIYELDGGRAIERATTTGDVFKWVRVR